MRRYHHIVEKLISTHHVIDMLASKNESVPHLNRLKAEMAIALRDPEVFQEVMDRIYGKWKDIEALRDQIAELEQEIEGLEVSLVPLRSALDYYIETASH